MVILEYPKKEIIEKTLQDATAMLGGSQQCIHLHGEQEENICSYIYVRTQIFRHRYNRGPCSVFLGIPQETVIYLTALFF